MSSLEDKILGEKLQYYCDSSDDDEEESTPVIRESSSTPRRQSDGASVNTGPKGVLQDWQRYKQLEAQRREENEVERQALVQKLSLTCRSQLDDEKEKAKEKDDVDKELADILDDDIFKEYIQKRMKEFIAHSQASAKFGRLYSLDSSEAFLEAIDKEQKEVLVVIHLYENGASGCEAMNGCLHCLSRDYPQVKFCKMRASLAGVSNRFKVMGVPALLVYKGGTLVGNFVRLTDEFGDDFFADSVESFLVENGILHDKVLVPEIIRQSQQPDESEGHSDFDVD